MENKDILQKVLAFAKIIQGLSISDIAKKLGVEVNEADGEALQTAFSANEIPSVAYSQIGKERVIFVNKELNDGLKRTLVLSVIGKLLLSDKRGEDFGFYFGSDWRLAVPDGLESRFAEAVLVPDDIFDEVKRQSKDVSVLAKAFEVPELIILRKFARSGE